METLHHVREHEGGGGGGAGVMVIVKKKTVTGMLKWTESGQANTLIRCRNLSSIGFPNSLRNVSSLSLM